MGTINIALARIAANNEWMMKFGNAIFNAL